jgi:hypothetical protein
VYLLDTMIVSYFLDAQHEVSLATAARAVPLAIVDEVRRELRNNPRRGGTAFEKWLVSSNIDIREIQVGSPASSTFAQLLHPASPDRDRGERASPWRRGTHRCCSSRMTREPRGWR